MNAATRIIETPLYASVSEHKQSSIFSSFFTGILVIVLLISALGIIYVKDLNRRLFIQYQTLQQEKNQEMIEWGKLMLEQSTWSTQSRIQAIAEKDLNMQMPQANAIVLVNANKNLDNTKHILAAARNSIDSPSELSL